MPHSERFYAHPCFISIFNELSLPLTLLSSVQNRKTNYYYLIFLSNQVNVELCSFEIIIINSHLVFNALLTIRLTLHFSLYHFYLILNICFNDLFTQYKRIENINHCSRTYLIVLCCTLIEYFLIHFHKKFQGVIN